MTCEPGGDETVVRLLGITWRERRRLVGADLFIAVILGGAAGFLTPLGYEEKLDTLYIAAAGVAASLLAVVITALALIATLFAREFVDVLAKAPGGIAGELWPLWLIVGVSVVDVLSAGYGFLMVGTSPIIDRAILGLVVFLTAYILIALLFAVSGLVNTSISRAIQLRQSGSSDRG